MPGRAGKVKGGKQKVEKKEKKEKSECPSSRILTSMAPSESQCRFLHSRTCLLDQTPTDADACCCELQCTCLRLASFSVMPFSGVEHCCPLWWPRACIRAFKNGDSLLFATPQLPNQCFERIATRRTVRQSGSRKTPV